MPSSCLIQQSLSNLHCCWNRQFSSTINSEWGLEYKIYNLHCIDSIWVLVHHSLFLLLIFMILSYSGEQGWHSGESTRLPPMWHRFDSRTRHHMWVEFVVGSLLCSERFFSGYSGFPLSAKTNISKFQFDPECSSV